MRGHVGHSEVPGVGQVPRSVYHGGAGNDDFDVFRRPDGRDAFFGGPDRDRVGLLGGGPVVIDLSTGILDGGFDVETLRSIENASSSRGDDTVIGNAARNVLFSGEGDDNVEGRGGNDLLFADPGTDFLDGGAGTDECLDGETVLNCEA
jgi:Ca2+-binding RTX toxin-like protein